MRTNRKTCDTQTGGESNPPIHRIGDEDTREESKIRSDERERTKITDRINRYCDIQCTRIEASARIGLELRMKYHYAHAGN
ncbi:hypothetical protein EVAR_49222_1 [Eumeta japonica]|uniref:Uncharacterized protein n=1 Tax=Eumeta variegata TaxID=151549 RepID=A0A4C1XN81_EUMVA|nr:hypothetical protein EVAR_49222_1 [Eumeta japonica]